MTEYLAENSQLRQLSRRYAEGALPLADYRTARRELLQGLLAGKVKAYTAPAPRTEPSLGLSADATSVRNPDDSAVFYKTMPPSALSASHPATQEEPAAPSSADSDATDAPWDSSARTLALVIGALLVVAVGALVCVFVL